ncbi:MAG: hypothetical protein L0Y73_08555, partial [Candidatus Aminicenantes bacterium]|nr:hypothetical protein [Candidatus Aminicenantes bacterium]
SELSDIIKTIENGSREQSTGMEQINLAVAQLEQVINQNAELVNNFVKAGKEMNANAEQLRTLMEQFIIEADSSQPPQSPPSPKAKKSTGSKEAKKEIKKEVKKADDFFSEEEGNFEEF